MGEVIPGTRAVIKEQIVRSYETVFGWRSGLVFTSLLGTLLAFAILSWDKATGLSAEERKEIGILKALGWETNDILEMKFWEGMVISVTSFLIGIILAYLHIFILGSFLLVPAIVGWSVLYPPFNLTPYLDIGQIFLILFITVVPYTAATIIPTWKASSIDPDEVIRGT
jgi:ABC-type lipoprotein release transport system permease subunit